MTYACAMKDTRSSITADLVATARAALSSNYLGSLIGHEGQTVLPATSRLFLRGLETRAAPLLWKAFERAVGATGYLAGRTMYFDEQIRLAMDRGIDQIVLVGAGFDMRASRLSRSGVTYFELDHPATQATKVQRIRAVEAPAHRVPVDLRSESLAAALEATPFDDTRPAFFLWEGVTMYLEADEIDRTLDQLAKVAAPASTLALDATDQPDPRLDTLASHLRRRLVARAGEPFKFKASIPALTTRMRDHGWIVRQSADAISLFERHCAHTCLRPPHRPTNYVVTAERDEKS